MDILEMKNLSFHYPEADQKALNRLSVSISEGEFVVLCGPSGCGKTTLLRLLKKEIAPHGMIEGDIFYKGKQMNAWDERQLMEEIGFVFQDPENQIILDDVMQELVFSMESLGYSNLDMRMRVSEMAHTFGIEHLLNQKTSDLSGGQKQILNLLSVLLLKPRVLLLDEPTSQLDPIAAKDLMIMLERLNKELGMTIILVEHRLEELFGVADRILMMDEGKIVYDGKSREIIHSVFHQNDSTFLSYLPSVSRLFLETEPMLAVNEIPLNVKEAKTQLATMALVDGYEPPQTFDCSSTDELIRLKEVYFQFEKDLPMVLRKLSLTVHKGDFYTIVGGNGSGKSTLLKTSLGIFKPQRGKVRLFGQKINKKTEAELFKRMAYLPQNPRTYFIQDSIEKEMEYIATQHQLEQSEEQIERMLALFSIEHLRHRHPDDCSGGEIQKAALACMLMTNPEILIIDEPTKGLDPISKEKFADHLKQLHKNGLTIVMVTHDIEFAAQHSTKCAMMFDGQITAEAPPQTFFKGNYFYTTTINRVTQNSKVPEVLTLEEALAKWRTRELA